jgi:hypothetical protein
MELRNIEIGDEECDFEFRDRILRCNRWQLDLEVTSHRG